MAKMDEDIFLLFQADLEVVKLITQLLDTMSLDDLADASEIDSERLEKILALDGNPSLGEIKRLAKVAGKCVKLEFV